MAAPNDSTLPQEVSASIPDHGTAPAAAMASEKSPSSKAEPNAVTAAPASVVGEEKSESQHLPAPAAVIAAETAANSQSVDLIQDLWATAKANGHPEIWGVVLADPATHAPTQIVLQKYLNANDGDLAKAKHQLTETLDWRAKWKPLELVQKKYSKDKFGQLGFVTTYTESEHKEVFTWNIYGGVKSIANTFGKIEEFLQWRVALMEIALQDLAIGTATEPIDAHVDPYKIFQVHDYKGTSFFRSPPEVRSASKETISVFAQNYPELLKEKFFINVPAVMGFMYGIIKVFAPAKTVKKFHPMSDGTKLALEFGDSKVVGLGKKLPKEYGGDGGDLQSLAKEPFLE